MSPSGDTPDLGPLLPIRALGESPRGQVYLAALPQRSGVLAVKLLRSELLRDEAATERFLNLATRLARTRHRHLANVVEARRLGGGQVVVAMEYLNGRDLARRVSADGPLTPRQGLDLGGQICAGLAAAHGVDICHLGLSPGNVFLVNTGGDEQVKLLDFGLADLPAAVADGDGGDGGDVYRAPEILAGRPGDVRSDVYSVGVLLTFALTGTVPLDGLAAAEAIATCEADGVLPTEFADLVLRCLASDPEDRWASVVELGEELRRLSSRSATQPDVAPSSGRKSRPGVVRTCPECGAQYPPHLKNCAEDGHLLGSPEVGKVEEHSPQPGSTIGPYYVVRAIGEGGMARIYLVEHVLLGQRRAIKMLLPELGHSPTAVQRFFHEAQVIAQLSHPHIIEVFEFVQQVGSQNYYVMEFLDGASLASLLRQKGRLPPARAVAIAGQVCDALGAVHDLAVVHRDLKPENIFLLDSGSEPDFVKLLDFGVAKLVDAAGQPLSITRTGIAVGTVEYMAPEQAAGEAADHRVDVWALGAILFEMLTGRLPYDAETIGELLVQQHARRVPAPSKLLGDGAGIPRALDAAVLRCLERKPGKRFASMDEARAELERALAAPEA